MSVEGGGVAEEHLQSSFWAKISRAAHEPQKLGLSTWPNSRMQLLPCHDLTPGVLIHIIVNCNNSFHILLSDAFQLILPSKSIPKLFRKKQKCSKIVVELLNSNHLRRRVSPSLVYSTPFWNRRRLPFCRQRAALLR